MNNENEFKTPEERLDKFKDLNEATDNEDNRTANNNTQSAENVDNAQLTSDDGEDLRETLGGATNLSLDQLKEDDNDTEEGS